MGLCEPEQGKEYPCGARGSPEGESEPRQEREAVM